MKISGIIIAKNVESQIADCIDSLSFCNEIIVVDNESEDRTVEIAEKMKANIVRYPTSDFSKLRDIGFKKATGDWIMYVDSDERVTKELVSSIKYQVLSIENNEYSAFKIKRKNYYLGNHEWPYIEKLERVFKKDKLKGWYGELHESPKVDGKIGELDGYLYHFTHRDLRSMLEKTIKWSKIEAELRFKSGHPKMTWWRFPRVMISAFLKSYIHEQGWKVGVVGLIESMYQAFSIFVTYARLWELQQGKK